MLYEKFKLKLTVNELNVLQVALLLALQMPLNSNDFRRKMLVCAMQKIHEKVLAKWNYPTRITKISLSNTEAIAFYLMFNDEYFTDEFADLTIRTICNKIHKQYI